APAPPAGGGLPDARLARRGRRRRPGHLAAPHPGRSGSGREPRRVADHGRGPRLPEHAAVARHPTRGAPRPPPPRPRHQPSGGAFDALVSLLDPDVVLRSDFGARRPAAAGVTGGAAAVARQALAGALPTAHLHPALVNGAAGVVVTVNGRPFAVLGFTVTQGR